MTSKGYIPSRHQSIYAQNEKRQYGLRPLKNNSKVHKKNAVSSSASSYICGNRGNCRTRQSVLHFRGGFSASTTKKNLPKKCATRTKQPLGSNVDVNDFIRNADFSSLTDVDDDAFQLAKYMESSDSIDQIINVPQTDATYQNATSASARTSQHQDASIAEMRLEELLDMSIKELQMATDTTANVAPVNDTPMATLRNPNNSIEAENCSGQCDTIDPNDHMNPRSAAAGNSSMRRPTESNIATTSTNTVRNVSYDNMFKEPDVFPSSSTNAVPNSTFGQTPYTTLTKNIALKKGMINLFNRSCYNYLNDRICVGRCKWNHNLPSVQDIARKLMRMPDDNVVYMYTNFVLKNSKAFVTYFSTFCEVFGKRKHDGILLSAIGHCEQRKKFPFLKFIFNGFVLTGSSKRGALTMITNYSRQTRECFDVFLEIIIETDALYFIDMLKKYYLYGTISTQSLLKLFQQVIDAPGTALLPVFIDILDKYSMYSAFDVEAFKRILPRVQTLVVGHLGMSQQLNHIVQRMQ